ncbi:MAG: Crp/Fnr family transcriptional regulator [Deltaproteobacteria bacterium]|nr:Crp/Fnr family transcriptional regulator [Deltaproteobacteria bacterium]
MADDKLYERFGREFPAGHVLCRDGDPGKEMFVIQSGKVRISKTVRGIEKTLVVLGPGAFFGEMSILNNKPRSATATVEENAKLLVIDPKTFEAMVRGNAEIAVRLIKTLAQRLQEADDQIENLLLKDPNSRLVHFLINTAKKHLPDGEDGSVNLDLAVRDLAGKAGLELDQVNEVLNKLIRAKLVQIVDNGLIIHNVKKLREFLDFLGMKEKFGDI